MNETISTRSDPMLDTEEPAEAGIPALQTCCRRKLRTEEERTQLIHRLNRIEGQIRGIRNMVERDAYCTDVLIQVSAAIAALNGFSRELFSQHMRTCVANDLSQGSVESLDEALKVLQKLMK
ncbi:MAG: metal-sensing transcriptional repressor [Faecalibacterium sp.]